MGIAEEVEAYLIQVASDEIVREAQKSPSNRKPKPKVLEVTERPKLIFHTGIGSWVRKCDHCPYGQKGMVDGFPARSHPCERNGEVLLVRWERRPW